MINFLFPLAAMLILFIWAQLYMKMIESWQVFRHIKSPENMEQYTECRYRLIMWTLFCFLVSMGTAGVFLAKDAIRLLDVIS